MSALLLAEEDEGETYDLPPPPAAPPQRRQSLLESVAEPFRGIDTAARQAFGSGLAQAGAGLTRSLANIARFDEALQQTERDPGAMDRFVAARTGVGTEAARAWTPAQDEDEDWFERVTSEAADSWAATRDRFRYRPDAATQGWASQIVGGVVEPLTSALAAGVAGGPLTGAVATGVSMGETTEKDLLEQGADAQTAREAGQIMGLTTAGLFALPAALEGNVVQRMLSGAAINTAGGAAQRGSMEAYLNERGQPQLAEQYKWLDPTSIAVDGILGAAFGYFHGSRPPAPRSVPRPEGQSREERYASPEPAQPPSPPREPARPVEQPMPSSDEAASLRARVAELETELRTDSMTGLRNFRAFDEDEGLGWGTVGALDLDGLKRLNDTLGHDNADEVIRAVADVLHGAEADDARFYRRSGDEFTARFRNADDAEAVLRDVQQRLRNTEVRFTLEKPDGSRTDYILDGIGVSLGHGQTREAADQAAYADKAARVASGERQDPREPGPPRRLYRIPGGEDRRAFDRGAANPPEEYLNRARQFAIDEDYGPAYAHALIARNLGEPGADEVIRNIEEDGGEAAVREGTEIANRMLRESVPSELTAAAMIERDSIRQATQFGVPANQASARWAAQAAERMRQQAENDEVLDPGIVPEDVSFVPLPVDQAQAEATVRGALDDVLRDEGLTDEEIASVLQDTGFAEAFARNAEASEQYPEQMRRLMPDVPIGEQDLMMSFGAREEPPPIVRMGESLSDLVGSDDAALIIDALERAGVNLAKNEDLFERQMPIRAIPLGRLKPNKRDFADLTEGAVEAYADGGEMPPIVVRQNAAGQYEIINGHHRLAAAQRRGDATIEAMDASDYFPQPWWQPLFSRGFHGSGSIFDRFDINKVGTGQGASTYGWGIYIAGNERTGAHYRDEVGGVDATIDGQPMQSLNPLHVAAYEKVRRPQWDDAYQYLRAQAQRNRTPRLKKLYNDAAKIVRSGDPLPQVRGVSRGQLYEVDFPDGPYLDWDKPLWEQAPEVQAAIAKLLPGASKSGEGEYYYNELAARLGGPKKLASEALRAEGVVGNKYLDQLSRDIEDEAQRTYNYVLFDDKGIEIVTRNGERLTPKEAEMLASRGDRTSLYGGSSPEALRAAALDYLGRDAERLLESGKTEIFGTAQDLSRRLGKPVPVDAKGVYDPNTGKSYLVAQNVSPRELGGILLHEIGVHTGMRGMVGDRAFTRLMARVDELAEGGNLYAKAATDRVNALVEQGLMNPAHAAEEKLAYLVENASDLPVVRKLLAQIRQWLYRTFGGAEWLGKLTVEDIRDLAVTSLRRQARLAEREARGSRPFYLGSPDGEPVNLLASMTPGEFQAKYGRMPNDSELDQMGFRSVALEAAKALPDRAMRGEEAVNRIAKARGVTGMLGSVTDEIAFLGLREEFAGKKSVTKAEIEEFIRAHRLVLNEAFNRFDPKAEIAPEARVYFEPTAGPNGRWALSQGVSTRYFDTEAEARAAAPEAARIARDAGVGATRQDANAAGIRRGPGDLRLPGDEPVFELRLKIPEFGSDDAARREAIAGELQTMMAADPTAAEYLLSSPEGGQADTILRKFPAAQPLLDELRGMESRRMPGSDFDSHWSRPPSNDKGVLVSVRGEERLDDQGKRTLFGGEVQSDLAQQLRSEKDRLETELRPLRDAMLQRDRPLKESVRVEPTLPNPGPNYDGPWTVYGPDGSVIMKVGRISPNPDTVRDWALAQKYGDIDAINSQIANVEAQLKAPLTSKTSAWTGAAVRAMIYRAARDGFDSVSFPTGETSKLIQGNGSAAEHYDTNVVGALRKVAHAMGGEVRDGSVEYPGYSRDVTGRVNAVEVLEDAGLSADLARRIDSRIVQTVGSFTPDALSQVRQTLAGYSKWNDLPDDIREHAWKALEDAADNERNPIKRNASAYVMPITPEMRSRIVREGLPLFSRGWEDAAPTDKRNTSGFATGRREPPAGIPDPGTEEYAALLREAQGAQSKGEKLTAPQRAILQWEKEGPMFSFGGARARTADANSLGRAEQMAAEGADETAIWQETGWWKSPVDGLWRFEIDDSGAKFFRNFKEVDPQLSTTAQPGSAIEFFGRLSKALDFPELFAAYPDLAGLTVRVRIDNTIINADGAYDPEVKTLTVDAPTTADAMNALLHELQHAIQWMEGFSVGGNLEMARNEGEPYYEQKAILREEAGYTRERWESLPYEQKVAAAAALERTAAFRTYLRYGGEIEARNVQRRRGDAMPRAPQAKKLTAAERRATPPEQTQDLPSEAGFVSFYQRNRGSRLVVFKSIAEEPGNSLGDALGEPPGSDDVRRPEGGDGAGAVRGSARGMAGGAEGAGAASQSMADLSEGSGDVRGVREGALSGLDNGRDGWDIEGYHVTTADFTEFQPSPYRKATFFARTPQGAVSGAAAGGNEFVQGGRGPGPIRTIPVRLRSRDIDGFRFSDAEEQFIQTLPERLYNEEEFYAARSEIDKHRPLSIYVVYDAVEVAPGKYEYVRKPLPQLDWDTAERAGRDVYGIQWAHYAKGGEAWASDHARERGFSGFAQQDEAGLSIGMIDPEQIRSRFDERFSSVSEQDLSHFSRDPDPVKQALIDEPELRIEDEQLAASALEDAREAETQAREMKKGIDAAASCAAQQGMKD